MTTVDTARPNRRGAQPSSVSTYALGTYPAFADNPACACRGHDPDLFFPEPGGQSGGKIARAKAICRGCPLVDRCRAWAIDQLWLEGVWGATTTPATQAHPPLPHRTGPARRVPARPVLPLGRPMTRCRWPWLVADYRTDVTAPETTIQTRWP